MGLTLEPGSDRSNYGLLDDGEGHLWADILAKEPRTVDEMCIPTQPPRQPVHSCLDVLMHPGPEAEIVNEAARVLVESQLDTTVAQTLGGFNE